ncbi:MAG TPA: class I SAM-dependent methyltransferase [Candidatus Hydrogenedentes bacterium]|nr:class I SAM-dependent methyltransferase [Candidatus Hydrogenedentota bacterium]HPC17608.1 class I SAM-dependent methyltransferase [Candidatus Hydrogenedentota bacterium]HRT21526.1 class I SAM-dependent methyltransferase [Candidatus Hydrogenedentota bacterium]HRT65997.1 class I SAM-dependent methyltransferase [Candidatus Hydrogenedentota bacterium]
MNREEYAIMFATEDRHWWYAGLRAMLDGAWRRHLCIRNPLVLDAGCGTGATLQWIAGRTSRQPVGFDISPDAMRFCRQRGLAGLVQASVLAMPFSEAEFDAVVSLDVLYHRNVPDRMRALAAIFSALKPGGFLILNLPAYGWLRSSHDEAVHTAHRFTRGECVEMLRAAGFEVLQATYWNTLLFPAIVATRLWRKMRPPADSDLAPPGAMANRLFGAVLGIERKMAGLFPLPFGLSVFTVARKPEANLS